MRIKCKEAFKHHPYYPHAGDIITVDDAAGAVIIGHGWAENADTGESGTRSTEPATLDVQGAAHKSKSTIKG